MDWQFTYDSDAVGNAETELTESEINLLGEIRRLSAAVTKSQVPNLDAWRDFTYCLQTTVNTNLPMHEIELASRLRGTVLKGLITGELDYNTLIAPLVRV